MNIETAKASIGKPVLIWSHMPKLIAFRKGDMPHGPVILKQITKSGLAILEGCEDVQFPPRLLTLYTP